MGSVTNCDGNFTGRMGAMATGYGVLIVMAMKSKQD